VTAAREWNGAAETRSVRPALPDSYEDLFRRSRLGAFYLPLQGEAAHALREPHLERAIGVLYIPETEYASHYFAASLPHQFDAVIHIDETRAVEPLGEEAPHKARAA
jgi:erythromycin esterase-like protein